MKKFGLVLAAAFALAAASLSSVQPARADGGVIVGAVLLGGWGWCHITYGQPRVTPACAWHDAWHARWHPAPAPAPKAAPKKK
jgi:hypothetical protein